MALNEVNEIHCPRTIVLCSLYNLPVFLCTITSPICMHDCKSSSIEISISSNYSIELFNISTNSVHTFHTLITNSSYTKISVILKMILKDFLVWGIS